MSSAEIGHNNPPPNATLAGAERARAALADYLSNNPVIADEPSARSAKAVVDLTKAALDEMERERDARVRPLNEQVRAVNGEYKSAREPVEKLLGVLKDRINDFLNAERERREAEARAAAECAAAAEAEARAAEAREKEAIENAKDGEFTDVGSASAEADAAFGDFKAAARQSARAERDARRVVVGGGFGRALSQRTSELFKVEDPIAALREIVKERGGALPEKIDDAIIAAAKDFRKAKGRLPKGVTSTKERTV